MLLPSAGRVVGSMSDELPDMNDYECDFELDDDEWDEDEEAIAECGLLPKHLGGGCQLAGSEHCDFECPFRDNPGALTGDVDGPIGDA